MFGQTPAPAPAEPQYHEEECSFVVSLALASGNAFADLKLNLDADYEFVLTHLIAKYDQAFSFNFNPPSGPPVFSTEVQAANCFGTAQFPRPLLVPMVFSAGSQIKYAVTNLHAGDNNIEIVFGGYRRYRVN